jgi:hypothetical protein
MVPTRLWGLTDPLEIGRRKQATTPLNKESLEPLFAKNLRTKVGWWIPSLVKHWLPFVTNDCPGALLLIRPNSARLKLRMA